MLLANVSVVIAAHNDEHHIIECLNSVIAANAAEIIVVDDASTDGTLEQIKTLQAERVRVISLSKNVGPSAARNVGLAQINNRYCAIVDADDLIPSERLTVMLGIIQKTSASIMLDNLVAFDSNTDAIMRRQLDCFPMSTDYRQIMAVDMIKYDLGSLKPMLDMDQVKKLGVHYPENIRRGEDFLFLLEIIKKGAPVFVTRVSQYRLRRKNSGRLTSNRYKLYSELLRNELSMHLQYSWSMQEHMQLSRRHFRNSAGILKNALKVCLSRKK